MKYALRKLIAFVFLGGMFWYIFYDVENIFNPSYMAAIGGMVIIFTAFMIIVPLSVVWIRILKRTRKNYRGYRDWCDSLGPEGPKPHRANHHLNIDPDEVVWFHEKGTFYIEGNPAFDQHTVPGRIGDVAFPHEPRDWRKAQRVHCYFTDRRVLFLGKEIDCDVRFHDVVNFKSTVGGLVFEMKKGELRFRVAFTFVNPLIAAHVLRLQVKTHNPN